MYTPSMPPRLRTALALVAVLGIGWSAAQYLDWQREQRRLGDLLDRLDAERAIPGLPRHVRRANDPLEARMRAGRALVAHYLDPTWVYELPEAERLAAWRRSLDGLEEIRAMAAETMAERPTSWEAAMLYGASAYLLERRPDATDSERDLDRWVLPLERSVELIPAYIEPVRYLSVAYVDHWQGLSSDRRRSARTTLARAFRDGTTFAQIIEAWLRLVPDRREALAIVPDEVYAWERLENIFQRNKEWSLYLEVHRRLRLAEARHIRRLLDEAEQRVSGGDYQRGTRGFHHAVSLLEPSIDNIPLLERILGRMPAGPPSRPAEASFRKWLEWTLRLGFLDRSSPLEARHLLRLVGSADAALHEAALAHLLAADLPAAEQIERRHAEAFEASWGPYLTLKADALLDRDELDGASRSLLLVRAPWRTHPTFLAVRRRLAERLGDAATVADIDATRARLARVHWSGTEMSWSDDVARLEMLPARAASGLAVEIAEARPDGQPLELWWNGRLVAPFVVHAGESLEVSLAVAPEPALFELRVLDRRPLVPGLITLLGRSP